MKRFLAALILSFLASSAFAAAPVVELHTNRGVITLELDPERAPVSVENFLVYVQSGYYDGTIFHRVIDGFMIQGGGFEPGMKQKSTRSPIRNEADNGLKNKAGTVAMARTADPDSATAQFFINLVDNPALDRPRPDGHGYAVFGKVLSGMDIVHEIKNVRTGSKGFHQNVPLEDIVIERAALVTSTQEQPDEIPMN